MDRNDFIETREDIVQNIKTLYSYLDGKVDSEHKDWAIQRMSQGKNYVIEVVDSQIYFAPSRFIGYVDNTMEKHEANPGNGTETDKKIKNFYQKVQDVKLDALLQKAMSEYSIVVGAKKYWISKDTTVDDILSCSAVKVRRYWIARLSDDNHWDYALENNLWLMQQRYDIQRNHIVTQLLNLVKEIRVGDVLLLTFDNIIYAYGIVVRCPFQTRQISNLQNIVSLRQYDYNDGIVCFEDAPAFYEDLRDGEENWGQRVSVDQWHCYDNDSTVYNSGCQSALLAGNTQQSIFEVDAKFAQDKIKELEKQYYKKYMFINNTAKLLKSKHNIILQGAPGTGKTYNTAAIALSVLGIDGVDLDNHDEVMKKYEELQDDRIFFTTFHQSLDYEDFVEGLKPRVQTNENGESLGVTYEPEDGIFKRACNAVVTDDSKDIIECIDDYLQKIKGFENRREIPTVTGKSSLYVWWKEGNKTVSSRSTNSTSQREESYSPSPLNIEKIKAQALGKGCENNWQQYAQAFIEAVKKEYHAKTDKSVVLIIDEINRGNVSKIFGELITLLEADKRDKGNHPIKVTLPYSKTLFGVPSNLYIIGTMNTTDRSTGTLDYALRRRFAFVTLKSDPNVIVKHYEKLGNDDLKAIAIDLFNNIKAFITSPRHLCGDLCIDDLMVGHSYFMASSKEELQYKVEFEIIPLIAEYINDGILTVNDQEKEKTFDAWTSLHPVQIVNNEVEENIDEEDE